ncbi:MAG: acetate--CoA ligase [Proteobacteria bacterium]|nr:acetate--CoA ligase [Pseudomonadota bacterium]
MVQAANQQNSNFSPSLEYQAKYQESITNPDKFWLKESQRLSWIKNPTIVKNTSFDDDISIKWFEDGELNVCYNCVDRHVENGNGNNIAIIWEGDDPSKSKSITYNELFKEVCAFANILEKNNIKKGDRVVLYMPMIPEAAYAMLAIARIGAIHTVVFGGFSPNALADRIDNCHPKLIITADEGVRGNKTIPLKHNVDQALEILNENIKTLIVKNTGNSVNCYSDRDLWYEDEKNSVPKTHTNIAIQNAEDPLFILHTSGSTGKPKGLLHTSGGYLLYAAMTFAYSFDYKKGDVFWCSADIGWVTGHSYVIYGPLANGGTTLMFEGVPNYPDPSRFWQVIDKHKVNSFYTAPTAIRALMKEGDKYVKNTSRKSLKILGTVGEPINPEAWDWYNEVVGENNCQIVDTWWQTETGGHMIAPLPNHIKPKAGYACLPFFGVQPVIVDGNANILDGQCQGHLCIKDSWPGQARSIYGDHKRFKETYFTKFKGLYCTGDGAKRDEDGYYRITGRTDDVLNVSGHRIGTAEIEAALDKHEKVCESAVIGIPHEIKGEGIYAFVILNKGEQPSENLTQDLKQLVRKEIGPIVTPDIIHFTDDLPKTRSGKIMRRIIRKIANNDHENLGDLSSLTNPDIIEKLVAGYKALQK